MSKKDFIALADSIMEHNRCVANGSGETAFTPDQLDVLARFCKGQNYNFDRSRWLGYIAGENGPSGGTVKKARS